MSSPMEERGVRGGRRGSFGRGKRETRGNKWRSEHYFQGGTRADPLNLKSVGSGDEADVPDLPCSRTDLSDMDLEVEISKAINTKDPLNLVQVEKGNKRRKTSRAGSVDRATPERSSKLSPAAKKSRPSSGSQPGTPKKGSSEAPAVPSTDINPELDKKKNKKEYFNNKYCYGNFDRYYGTRLDGKKDDRLSMLTKEWFEKKSVLDIGCNVGFLTLSLAKEYIPRRILGIDIDEHLIGVARKNIRHYCDQDTEFVGKFPASFSNQFGPISNQSISFSTKFPDNIWFRTENYVLESDEMVEMVEEEFDVILALSITKWIHLNFGDDGLMRFFKRAFRQLLPGGRFILEPQRFDSYRKRAKMTDTLKRNYAAIQFKPEDFEMYLIETVGFERVEHLGASSAKSKGFERPVDVYMKRPPKFLEKINQKREERKPEVTETAVVLTQHLE